MNVQDKSVHGIWWSRVPWKWWTMRFLWLEGMVCGPVPPGHGLVAESWHSSELSLLVGFEPSSVWTEGTSGLGCRPACFWGPRLELLSVQLWVFVQGLVFWFWNMSVGWEEGNKRYNSAVESTSPTNSDLADWVLWVVFSASEMRAA